LLQHLDITQQLDRAVTADVVQPIGCGTGCGIGHGTGPVGIRHRYL